MTEAEGSDTAKESAKAIEAYTPAEVLSLAHPNEAELIAAKNGILSCGMSEQNRKHSSFPEATFAIW